MIGIGTQAPLLAVLPPIGTWVPRLEERSAPGTATQRRPAAGLVVGFVVFNSLLHSLRESFTEVLPHPSGDLGCASVFIRAVSHTDTFEQQMDKDHEEHSALVVIQAATGHSLFGEYERRGDQGIDSSDSEKDPYPDPVTVLPCHRIDSEVSFRCLAVGHATLRHWTRSSNSSRHSNRRRTTSLGGIAGPSQTYRPVTRLCARSAISYV